MSKKLPPKQVSKNSLAWGKGVLALLFQGVFWTLANVQKTVEIQQFLGHGQWPFWEQVVELETFGNQRACDLN